MTFLHGFRFIKLLDNPVHLFLHCPKALWEVDRKLDFSETLGMCDVRILITRNLSISETACSLNSNVAAEAEFKARNRYS